MNVFATGIQLKIWKLHLIVVVGTWRALKAENEPSTSLRMNRNGVEWKFNATTKFNAAATSSTTISVREIIQIIENASRSRWDSQWLFRLAPWHLKKLCVVYLYKPARDQKWSVGNFWQFKSTAGRIFLLFPERRLMGRHLRVLWLQLLQTFFSKKRKLTSLSHRNRARWNERRLKAQSYVWMASE